MPETDSESQLSILPELAQDRNGRERSRSSTESDPRFPLSVMAVAGEGLDQLALLVRQVRQQGVGEQVDGGADLGEPVHAGFEAAQVREDTAVLETVVAGDDLAV